MMSVEKKAMIAMAIIVIVAKQVCSSIVIQFLWLVSVNISVVSKNRFFPLLLLQIYNDNSTLSIIFQVKRPFV